MSRLPDAIVLSLWERTLRRSTEDSAQALLDAVDAKGDAARMPVGRRDAALLELHERGFGVEVVAVGACPVCGVKLELRFSTAQLRVAATGQPADDDLRVSADGWNVRFRLVTGADLAAVAGERSVDAALALLRRRCVLAADHHGAPVTVDDLPPAVIAAVEQRMEEADPGADLRLPLTCPGCGHRWSPILEPASFLTAQLEAAAEGLLVDVHLLAARYGWSESAILAMSRARRERYLRMAEV